MPLLNISTNKHIKNEQTLLKKSSSFISSLTKKPENFVMIKFEDSLQMFFAGTDKPCCFVDIKSIGSLDPSTMSKPICEFFSKELEISTQRIYIYFQDVDSHQWAWNNKPFS